jgi:hypothetical protein
MRKGFKSSRHISVLVDVAGGEYECLLAVGRIGLFGLRLLWLRHVFRRLARRRNIPVGRIGSIGILDGHFFLDLFEFQFECVRVLVFG